jgi:hypothetical protein
MYFSVYVGANSHLWRQQFPGGTPEQITSGTTEESGIAVAPDGRSLVTSVGIRHSAIWIHDAAGDRALTSEGVASYPRLSADGTRVNYLLQQNATSSPGGLRSLDLVSGKTDSLLPGLLVADYEISRDEQEVVFTTKQDDGESQIRQQTERTRLRVDLGELVGTLKGIIRGWRACFALGNSTKKLADLDWYVWLRLWRFLKKRQGARGRLYPAAFAEWERRSGLAYFYPTGRRGLQLRTSQGEGCRKAV